MSAVSETPAVDPPAPRESRAGRRVSRGHAGPMRPDATLRPWAVLGTVGLAALTTLSAYADPYLLTGALALTGLVLAYGWHDLLGAPAPAVPRVLTGLVALVGPITVAATPDEPYLRHVPVVVSGGLLVILLHQLVRRDGRPRLVEALSVSATALALLTCGVTLAPMPRMLGGTDVVACAALAVAAATLADLLVGRQGAHQWTLPLAMVLGGAASVATSLVAGSPRIGQAVLLGFLVGAVSHALRRVLGPLPVMVSTRGQLAAAAASLLVVGVVTTVFARVVLGQ